MKQQPIDIPRVVSEYLKGYLRDNDISQNALGERLGYAQGHINRLVNAKMSVGYQTVLRLARGLHRMELLEICGYSVPTDETNELLQDSIRLQIIGRINVGTKITIYRYQTPKQLSIPSIWVKQYGKDPNEFAFFKIVGDSLSGFGIFHNDLLMVDMTPTQIKQGSLCVAEYGEVGTVKYLWAEKGQFILHGLALPQGEQPPLLVIPKDSNAQIMPVIAQFRWHGDIPFQT